MFIEHIVQDTSFAVRQLRRAPMWALAIVLTLGLGIGANTGIFSILDALVLRKLPVREPDRLAEVAATYRNNSRWPFTFPLFQQIDQNQRVFSDLFGWSGPGAYNVQIDSTIFVGTVRAVSGNYYSALGAAPLIGRLIAPADAARIPGASVAVLGYEFWQQRFGRDPKVLGTTIRIEGEPFTVIGVSRKWFTGMMPGVAADITVPLTAGRFAGLATNRATGWISVAGRLRPGVTTDQAHTQIQSFWHDALVASAPTTTPGPRLQAWLAMRVEVNSAATGMTDLRSFFERPLKLLMWLVLLILLVACVNLANLMLARSEARNREITLRLSLGATPRHVVQQLLIETFLLSCIGTFFAFLLATWVSRLLVAMMTQAFTVTVIFDLRPDWRVFLFAAAAAVATAALIGLAPAWRASRREPADVLRADDRTSASGLSWLPKVLIVTQIGLSAVLLVGAGLLLRSFENLRTIDSGYQRDEVLQLELQRRPGGFDRIDLPSYRQQLIDEVVGLPGVRSASFAGIDIPFGGWTETVAPASTNSSAEISTVATLIVISPEFFKTVDISLVGGRNFHWSDDQHHPLVAIADSNLSRRLHPSGDATGMRVRFGVQPEFQQLEIIGIAHSARLVNLRSNADPVLFVPLSQHPVYAGDGALLVRSQNPAAITGEVESKIQSLGHEYATSAKTLQETSEDSLVEDRAVAILSSVFGGLALLLAGIGLFGLMSYAVTRRTREIGIRMALGSKSSAVLRLVLRESLLLSALGVIVGVPCALAATHLFSHFLFGVKPSDPVTLIATFAALLIVGMIAGYVPARRAAMTDPIIALRHE